MLEKVGYFIVSNKSNIFFRIGGKGDGGKWFCGEFTKPQEDCTIFSASLIIYSA